MSTESAEWKRPDSIPFPNVWWRCSGKKPLADGKIPKFRIQDATEDMFEEILDLMCKHFIREEHVSARMKVADDPESVEEFVVQWRKYLNQMITLVAILEEEGEEKGKRLRIAGFNILGVSLKTDKPMTSDMYKAVPSATVMRFILDFALKDVNIFEYYGVDAYMSALGLFVHPDFRGQGLSEHLIKARFPLGKALGLKATMTFFTPTAAHRAAEKAGMKVLKEAKFDEYKENGKVLFPNIPSKCLKVMVATFD